MFPRHLLKPTIPDSKLIYHELIGRGGFGDIYRATWQSDDLGDTEVATKKIFIPKNRQDISKDLKNEIKFLETLKHPSIIEFYGLAITSDHVVLVIEYAAKGSLFDYLQTRSELPRDLKTKWAIQIAHGLKYLREKNVLHRDIKSPNLLITTDNDMKICDFGISKVLTSTKTTKHSDKGSLKWQAPEIFIEEQLSPKADIYAFGIVLWEMETCKEPYKDKIAVHIMYKVSRNERPIIPNFCPPELTSLIEQCWHGDKNSRPEIQNVIEQLQHFKDDGHHDQLEAKRKRRAANLESRLESYKFQKQIFTSVGQIKKRRKRKAINFADYFKGPVNVKAGTLAENQPIFSYSEHYGIAGDAAAATSVPPQPGGSEHPVRQSLRRMLFAPNRNGFDVRLPPNDQAPPSTSSGRGQGHRGRTPKMTVQFSSSSSETNVSTVVPSQKVVTQASAAAGLSTIDSSAIFRKRGKSCPANLSANA